MFFEFIIAFVTALAIPLAIVLITEFLWHIGGLEDE